MKTNPTRSIALSAGLLLAASGQAQKTFDIRHDYNLSINLAPNSVVRTRWAWDDLARTSGGETRVKGDTMGGNPFAGKKNAFWTDATGTSSATSEVMLNVGGGKVTGSNHVFGSALATRPTVPHTTNRSFAMATSTIGFNVGAMDPKGKMIWEPNWRIDTLTGSASHWRDPLNFSLTNLDTGAVQSSDFFSADLSFLGPLDQAAQSVWENGFLDFSGAGASDGVLDITMNSPFLTSATGALHLRFAGGVVVESDDSGAFDGILPGVGSSSYRHLAIPNSFAMDFDFGGSSANGYDLAVTMDSSGTADDAVAGVPGPPAFLSGLGCLWAALRRRRNRTASTN